MTCDVVLESFHRVSRHELHGFVVFPLTSSVFRSVSQGSCGLWAHAIVKVPPRLFTKTCGSEFAAGALYPHDSAAIAESCQHRGVRASILLLGSDYIRGYEHEPRPFSYLHLHHYGL